MTFPPAPAQRYNPATMPTSFQEYQQRAPNQTPRRATLGGAGGGGRGAGRAGGRGRSSAMGPGYQTPGSVATSIAQRMPTPLNNPGAMLRGRDALLGNYGMAPQNAENAMLAPNLASVFASAPPAPQVPVNSMTPYAGQHLGLSARGIPITEPGMMEEGPAMFAGTPMGSAMERARQGGQFVAYRGPVRQNSEATGPSSVSARRENAPLPGFPRLPGRMNESERSASMNRRLSARGLSPMTTPGGEEETGRGRSIFGDNYTPPSNPDEPGTVDRNRMIDDAVSGLREFNGDLDTARGQLEEKGLNWDNDIRRHAMEELYPQTWDWHRTFSEGAREEWRERRRKYERLRELDPSLPEWPEPNFLQEDRTAGWDQGNSQSPRRPPQRRPPQQSRMYEAPTGTGSMF